MGRCQGSGQRGCSIYVPALGFIDWDGKRREGIHTNVELDANGAEGLAFLRAVDATEANSLRVGVVQDFDGGTGILQTKQKSS